jgi:hypothetical protein
MANSQTIQTWKRSRAWPIRLLILAIAAGAGAVCLGLLINGEPRGNRADPLPIPSDPPWFRDVATEAGVTFTYRNGAEAGHLTILESLGGGVALLDYDGDGLLDIFSAGGGYFSKPRDQYPEDPAAYLKRIGEAPPALRGYPCKLYRNLGNWKFQDVTGEVGLDRSWGYSHGVAVADYDRDGWPDLLVTGYGHVALLHNEADGRGGRRFVDVTAPMGLDSSAWATSAAWADIDGDGWPDLYVCHYADWSFANHRNCPAHVAGAKWDVCSPGSFKPLVHALYRNHQGKALREVSAEHGFRAEGYGLGVVIADLDDDGRPDIYVANDQTNKMLYLNRGGKLCECGQTAGVAVDDTGHYNGSMGVDAGDYDGSGRPALWVTNFQGDLHNLFRNLGGGLFQNQATATGIAAIGQHWVGFGTAFVDVDNDGWEDLAIANGHVLVNPMLGSTVRQRPVLLRNVEYQGRRFFKDAGGRAGRFFQTPQVGRGLAVGDLDNDGWPDLVICHMNSPMAMLRNEGAASSAANWLGIQLVGRDRRDVVGSTIIVKTAARRLSRFAKGGGSYLSASDRRIVFGLGAAEAVQTVTVKWSWGQAQSWSWADRKANAYWELIEGEAAARPLLVSGR